MQNFIETLILKKVEIYRRKAKKEVLKYWKKKRRKTAVGNPLSDTETIQYAEPYRDTFTKRDEIYRRKAKKTLQYLKALKYLTNKKT